MKKSTVFSFSSVPDRYNEESKNVQSIARKSPPSRSILINRISKVKEQYSFRKAKGNGLNSGSDDPGQQLMA